MLWPGIECNVPQSQQWQTKFYQLNDVKKVPTFVSYTAINNTRKLANKNAYWTFVMHTTCLEFRFWSLRIAMNYDVGTLEAWMILTVRRTLIESEYRLKHNDIAQTIFVFLVVLFLIASLFLYVLFFFLVFMDIHLIDCMMTTIP